MKSLSYLKKLLSISSDPISKSEPLLSNTLFKDIDINLQNEFKWLLTKKNGFYAFESSLHIFICGNKNDEITLEFWNREDGWIKYYKDVLTEKLIFFSQDIFACQYAISKKSIYKFEPETGKISHHSNSLNSWAKKIIEDYDYETGWSVANEWQKINGPLPTGHRLLPKTPFILGGDYISENMVLVPTEIAIDKLGQLYEQINDIPDGKEITINNWING